MLHHLPPPHSEDKCPCRQQLSTRGVEADQPHGRRDLRGERRNPATYDTTAAGTWGRTAAVLRWPRRCGGRPLMGLAFPSAAEVTSAGLVESVADHHAPTGLVDLVSQLGYALLDFGFQHGGRHPADAIAPGLPGCTWQPRRQRHVAGRYASADPETVSFGARLGRGVLLSRDLLLAGPAVLGGYGVDDRRGAVLGARIQFERAVRHLDVVAVLEGRERPLETCLADVAPGQAQQLYDSGTPVPKIAQTFKIGRSTIHGYITPRASE